VYLNMFPINQPEVLISHAMDRFDQEGNLTDVATRQHIIGLLQNLVDWVRRIGLKKEERILNLHDHSPSQPDLGIRSG